MEDQNEHASTMLEDDTSEYIKLDSVLGSLGTGRHQVMTMVMLALVYTTNSMYNVNYVFAVEDVNYRFGRKTAAVFAGTIGAVLGIAKSFSSCFWMYLVLEGLEGMIGDVFSPVFMLSIEMVEKKRALLNQLILMNCYTGGLEIMPLIAWAVPYWRNFLRVIYAPSLLILTYMYFLDESLLWLLSKGKRQRALQLISKIARCNNVELDERLLRRLQHVEETQELTDWRQLVKTFRSRIIMQRFLVCLVWWFAVTLINYGMMISSVFIEGNKYLNFSLLLIMDCPANVICWFVLAKCKRKVPLLVSFFVGGIFCICQPALPKGYAWAGLILLMVFEMFATFSYNVVYISTSELFPTYTRNSMHAICIAVGRIGFLVAPQMPLLMSLWSGLPTLVFGLLSMVAGVLTLLMPDTKNTELPNTVAEAERIGNMPVVKKCSNLHRR